MTRFLTEIFDVRANRSLTFANEFECGDLADIASVYSDIFRRIISDIDADVFPETKPSTDEERLAYKQFLYRNFLPKLCEFVINENQDLHAVERLVLIQKALLDHLSAISVDDFMTALTPVAERHHIELEIVGSYEELRVDLEAVAAGQKPRTLYVADRHVNKYHIGNVLGSESSWLNDPSRQYDHSMMHLRTAINGKAGMLVIPLDDHDGFLGEVDQLGVFLEPVAIKLAGAVDECEQTLVANFLRHIIPWAETMNWQRNQQNPAPDATPA